VVIGAIAVLAIFAVWMGWYWLDARTIYCPAASPPPAAFTERAALPSCGAYRFVRQDLPAAQRDCMNNARASGRGGELKIVESTTEGDPITTYYRVFSRDQRVEVFVDFSADQFGNGRWNHFFCWAAPLNYPGDPRCDSPSDQPDR
jgi:hypothetical protein